MSNNEWIQQFTVKQGMGGGERAAEAGAEYPEEWGGGRCCLWALQNLTFSLCNSSRFFLFVFIWLVLFCFKVTVPSRVCMKIAFLYQKEKEVSL